MSTCKTCVSGLLIVLITQFWTLCDAAEHSIVIDAAKSVVFGSPLRVSVEHRNGSEEVWQLDQPDRSHNFNLAYQLISIQDSRPHRVGFGERRVHVRKSDDGTRYDTFLKIPAPKINIAANDAYRFTCDLGQEMGAVHLTPGRWRISATNTAEKLEAAMMECDVVFTSESVDYALELASGVRHNGTSADWSRRWLKKVHSSIPLEAERVPPFATPEEAAAIKQKNRKDVDEFANWWKKNRATPEVQKLIDNINREYGLDPEKARREIEAVKPKSSE